MGQGYGFKCKKCGCKYSVSFGIGMMYPKVYRDKISEIEKGTYGAEWKELLDKTPYAAINGNEFVYLCDSCNRWETETDVTLYAPNDPESIPKKRYGIKTVEEWGYVPYVTEWDLKEDYHVLKRKYHICENCGRRMHKASEKELRNLPCPKCGVLNEVADYIHWD